MDKKIEILQWLSSLEDTVIIEKLVQFKKDETKDWWEGIQEEEKTSIQQGIENPENNKLNNHSSARKLCDKWL